MLINGSAIPKYSVTFKMTFQNDHALLINCFFFPVIFELSGYLYPQVILDGYSAPLTTGNFAKLVRYL